ncbi:hypothetical protein H6G89_29035 [Oscillatoria sp. FACHB-1407]|uniref:hypothetical protein n=1 Tax=Oscillatoria sp. FACHB-1407 TaxID=2692847 RepID=UPI001681EC3D|nr:hypothetical protein [Oscillatoria sp. FACHB-1407]MBD2465056.1 hypothetical protein [Oscillatoria sp. FACHB-1407]
MTDMQKQGKPTDQRADEWQRDLNPNSLENRNGLEGAQFEKASPTAYDIKELHRHLADYSDDELKRIVVLPTGTRLKEGATYIDLEDPERQEFTAIGGVEATPDHWYVPKTEVDYPLWNRLTGVNDPERLDQSPQR